MPGEEILAAGLFSQFANMYLNHQNNERNLELYEKQHQRAIEIMNMQNKYNSPIEQMKRLQAAGLNPNLVYGKGAVNIPAASASSSPIPSQASTFDIDPTTYFQNKIAREQLDLQKKSVDAEINLKAKQAETEEARKNNILSDTLSKDANTALTNQLKEFNDEMNQIKLSDANFTYEQKLIYHDVDYIGKVLANQETAQSILSQQVSDKLKTLLTNAEVYKLRADAEWTDEQKDFFRAVKNIRIQLLEDESYISDKKARVEEMTDNPVANAIVGYTNVAGLVLSTITDAVNISNLLKTRPKGSTRSPGRSKKF